MNKDDRRKMMKTMMEQFFGTMAADEKEEMRATMMSMLSGGAGDVPGKTQATSKTKARALPAPDRLKIFQRNSRTLALAQPELMETFWGLHKAAVAGGALDTKTKELIALAISVAVRCDDCIVHHVYDALQAGAAREEIAEALGVAILMGGGASVVYATHAIDALEQFAEAAGSKG